MRGLFYYTSEAVEIMSSEQIETLRRDLQQMRAESAAAHREIRQEMHAGFARLEKRFDREHDDLDARLRTLEVERGKLVGWLSALAAGAGGVAGYLSRLFGTE